MRRREKQIPRRPPFPVRVPEVRPQVPAIPATVPVLPPFQPDPVYVPQAVGPSSSHHPPIVMRVKQPSRRPPMMDHPLRFFGPRRDKRAPATGGVKYPPDFQYSCGSNYSDANATMQGPSFDCETESSSVSEVSEGSTMIEVGCTRD